MVQTVPFADITVPSPGFGAMGLSHGLGSNLSLEQAEPVLLKAIELGCTFWDTAVSGLSTHTYIFQKRKSEDVRLTWIAGRLPSWCQRKASRRLH
jgi:aryl-alcohol dehydrogenase-like predicted oxidoreductase